MVKSIVSGNFTTKNQLLKDNLNLNQKFYKDYFKKISIVSTMLVNF